jgi:hypothetical protein
VLADLGEKRFAKAANTPVMPLKLREFVQTINDKAS